MRLYILVAAAVPIAVFSLTCVWVKEVARLKLNLKAFVKIGIRISADSKSRSESESLEWLQSKQAALLSLLPPVFTLRFQSLATVFLIDVCAGVCMYCMWIVCAHVQYTHAHGRL